MSIASALSNALSGLSAVARGTETVSSNLANVMTPGYARREVALSSQGAIGGVRVDGIIRHVNENLLSEARGASSAQGDASTRATYLRRIEAVIGLPGEAHSLETALSQFQSALSSAAARPEEELRLVQLAQSASELAGRLNAATREVQAARTEADEAIGNDVASINAALEQVAYLNRRIAGTHAEGHDASALLDERQLVIARLSSIVPLQQVTRGGGAIALFTREGAVLLDGTVPARIGFTPAGLVQPGQTVNAGLSNLTLNGAALSSAQMRLFTGGSLGAHFAVRDELAPALQRDLDALALDLHARLADPAVDPTLVPGQSGVFLDPDTPVGTPTLAGLAGRLMINAAIDPAAGGQAWRLRAGLGATTPDPVSKSSVLVAMGDALNASRPLGSGSPFEGQASLAMRFAATGARVASARVGADNTVAVTSARLSMLQSRQMADGVDSDAEMQRLLQYEQAYAANARVIRAIDEMINYLLRM